MPETFDGSSLADRFLRLACLTYGDVGPAEWAHARALLADHPELTAHGIWAAAAAADVDAVGRALDADPRRAGRPGGPHGWQPLLYLCFARHDPDIAERDVIDTARLLLAVGADPGARFVIGDLPTPFTALTGAFGEGELGPTEQPRHPHSLALARVLLEGGAGPNDGQALYNRMFGTDDSHLALLFEFGLTGEPVRVQLAWAVTHGMTARASLLADHQVDITSPLDDPLWGAVPWATIDDDRATPSTLAAVTGHPEVVDLLTDRGAPVPNLTPAAALVAALLSGDRSGAEHAIAHQPGLVDHVRASRPGLMAWASSLGRTDVMELLVDSGFDINALGRTDVPSNQPWHTALHHAVEAHDLAMARVLLGRGADPDVTDQRFDSTPLGWARHLGRPALVELLEPVTAGD
jgi:ankyrin repeat protein